MTPPAGGGVSLAAEGMKNEGISSSVSMYLFFKRAVNSSPVCRDVILATFSQGLLSIGAPPANCSRDSSFRRWSTTTTVKSNSNKMVIIQCSTMAIHNHHNQKRQKERERRSGKQAITTKK